MHFRAVLYFALSMPLLLTGFATAAPGAAMEHLQQLTIYSARGASNSCGPGCDRWIAIEGKIDKGAAARVERFFRESKETQGPIYLHSPGGEVREAIAIGRLLRSRKAVGRVGQTIVDACPGTQTDNACAMIKTVREDVAASIRTRGAVCNSSCSYLLFGTVAREVAPDAVMGVHSMKVFMDFQWNATEKLREEATAKAYARADQLASSYLDEMGISKELTTLVDTVSYENAHVLTRQELYRFRIDTRDFAETAWTLEKTQHPYIGKMAMVKDGDGFRKLEWQLSCESKSRARLMFVDEVGKGAANAGFKTAAITAGSGAPSPLTRLPLRLGSREVWTASIASDAIAKFFAVPYLEIGQRNLLPDGKATSSFLKIGTAGLESGWAQLSATCAAARLRTSFPTFPTFPQSPSGSANWPASPFPPPPPSPR